jgi:hypothetical protein
MATPSVGQDSALTPAPPDDSGPSTDLLLPDVAALTDLQTFVGRAKQIEPAGAVRLVAHGPMLAAYASALHGGGAPTVLALRVLTLAGPSEVDATVTLAALTDRFALAERLLASQRPAVQTVGPPIRLSVPPVNATGATWAGMLPPRVGWSVEGVLRMSDLRRAAKAGIDEVAAGTPAGAGAAAVARLRALVWGRPLPGQAELPTGTAFAAEAFGFLGSARPVGVGIGIGSTADEVFDQNVDQDAVSLHRAGRWWRVSTSRGHILVRPAITLG